VVRGGFGRHPGRPCSRAAPRMDLVSPKYIEAQRMERRGCRTIYLLEGVVGYQGGGLPQAGHTQRNQEPDCRGPEAKPHPRDTHNTPIPGSAFHTRRLLGLPGEYACSTFSQHTEAAVPAASASQQQHIAAALRGARHDTASCLCASCRLALPLRVLGMSFCCVVRSRCLLRLLCLACRCIIIVCRWQLLKPPV
jgi:hypothetical protein